MSDLRYRPFPLIGSTAKQAEAIWQVTPIDIFPDSEPETTDGFWGFLYQIVSITCKASYKKYSALLPVLLAS